MAIDDEGDLTDAERRERGLAREIGALQKQARELERERLAATPAQPRAYKNVPRDILFLGGATESSEAEDADEAFRAADILRSRRVREDEATAEVVRYKSGTRKGQPRFEHEGTLASRNAYTLKKYVGKQVRVHIDFDQLSEGGRVTKARHTTRTLTYRDYDGLVRAYQDHMRATIRKKSPDAYYVKTIRFEPVKKPRCVAKTKAGTRCKRHATVGKYCRQHSKGKGGGT